MNSKSDLSRITQAQFDDWRAQRFAIRAKMEEARKGAGWLAPLGWARMFTSSQPEMMKLLEEMLNMGVSHSDFQKFILNGSLEGFEEKFEIELGEGKFLFETTPLTPEQLSLLAHNIANPRADWALPVSLHGEWQEQRGEDALALLEILGRHVKTVEEAVPIPIALHLDRVRTRPLACYGGALLVEAQGYDPLPGIFNFILHEHGVTPCYGRASAFFYLNSLLGLRLDSEEAIFDYVVLFLSMVFVKETRYKLLFRDIEFKHLLLNLEDREVVENCVVNRFNFIPRPELDKIDLPYSDAQTRFGGSVPILFDDGVYESEIVLSQNGMLIIYGDSAILSPISMHNEVFEGLMWRFKALPMEVS